MPHPTPLTETDDPLLTYKNPKEVLGFEGGFNGGPTGLFDRSSSQGRFWGFSGKLEKKKNVPHVIEKILKWPCGPQCPYTPSSSPLSFFPSLSLPKKTGGAREPGVARAWFGDPQDHPGEGDGRSDRAQAHLDDHPNPRPITAPPLGRRAKNGPPGSHHRPLRGRTPWNAPEPTRPPTPVEGLRRR